MFNTLYSRKKSGPRVMTALRNFVISILRLIGYQNIAKALRDMAAKPHIAINRYIITMLILSIFVKTSTSRDSCCQILSDSNIHPVCPASYPFFVNEVSLNFIDRSVSYSLSTLPLPGISGTKS